MFLTESILDATHDITKARDASKIAKFAPHHLTPLLLLVPRHCQSDHLRLLELLDICVPGSDASCSLGLSTEHRAAARVLLLWCFGVLRSYCFGELRVSEAVVEPSARSPVVGPCLLEWRGLQPGRLVDFGLFLLERNDRSVGFILFFYIAFVCVVRPFAVTIILLAIAAVIDFEHLHHSLQVRLEGKRIIAILPLVICGDGRLQTFFRLLPPRKCFGSQSA